MFRFVMLFFFNRKIFFFNRLPPIQIFVYRGIEGFVKFTSFELPSFVSTLTSIHLPIQNAFGCAKSYLAVTMKKEIRFIEAKACGYCGVNAELRCD